METGFITLAHPDPIERVTGSRYDYPFGGDDGYDWMYDANPRLGYKEIAGWGADGWDLGDWPYVIISVSKDLCTVLTYVEGDLTRARYASKADALAAIDAAFIFYAEAHVLDLLEAELGFDPHQLTHVDQLPERFRGGYRR